MNSETVREINRLKLYYNNHFFNNFGVSFDEAETAYR